MLVLDDTAIAEARLLHPTREGYFTVAQKHAPDEKGRTWSQRGYAMSSLEQILSAVRNVPDLYISQASFSTRYRGNATVRSVSASFIDLDCYKLGILPDEATVQAVVSLAVRNGLPEPSYVMSSGRGLYAKWIYDQPLMGTLIPHWKKLQDVLGHLFQAFGSDANARDLARVLRASSTMNSKSGETVRVVYNSGKIYRFADLAAIASKLDVQEFIETSKTTQRRIRAKQDSLIVIPSDLTALTDYSASREPVMMQQFSKQSLNWTRFIDLRDLMIRRQGAATGSRDAFLFWMTATLASSGVIDSNNFWDEVSNLLRGFPVSKDFDPLQDGTLETLRRRVIQHCNGHKVEFNGHKVSPIYTPSNDYLIDVLNITDDEMVHLKTIISSKEKQRRADQKVPGRQERRVERIETRAMAAELQRSGKNITQIAAELGVNKSTVSRWLAPAEINKTREYARYMSMQWDSARVEAWMEKRKASLAERQHLRDLELAKQESLAKAQKAQTDLKISATLMSIYDKIMLKEVEPVSAELRSRSLHPLEPPREQAVAPQVEEFELPAQAADADDFYEEDFDDDETYFDRPRG